MKQSVVLMIAEDFLSGFINNSGKSKFDKVIMDLLKVYPSAILVGAVAVAKYLKLPIEPRVTYDVDFLLNSDDFEGFLQDEIQERKTLEKLFNDSDSPNHSLKHAETDIYVDLMSVQSKPLKKKIVNYILGNPAECVVEVKTKKRTLKLLKPEFLIVMKLHRIAKSPNSEKGISDRLDVIKIIKTYLHHEQKLDLTIIEEFTRKREFKKLSTFMAQAKKEIEQAGE